jgi:pSer/pThr/pTyr-binding forkhead associated (FHA) protein
MPPHIELSAVEHRIGRSPVQADIVLENDITVSRLHASIVLEGSDYRIYDEGSSSGTWVNGQKLPDYGHQLLDGDEIRLGDAWMRYRR